MKNLQRTEYGANKVHPPTQTLARLGFAPPPRASWRTWLRLAASQGPLWRDTAWLGDVGSALVLLLGASIICVSAWLIFAWYVSAGTITTTNWFLILSSHHQLWKAARSRSAAASITWRPIVRFLPYIAVVAGYALLLVEMRHGDAGVLWGLLIGTNILTGLVLIRQIVVLRENQRLLDERKQFEQRLWRQAFHDPLTGLANRALLHDRIAAAVVRAKRYDSPAAVLMLDLDGFKTVNDSLGHAAGDQLLVTIGGRLSMCVREVDLVARLGGDEFAILLEHIHDLPAAIGLAERILMAIEEPVVIENKEIIVHGSIGIAAGQSCGADADELLRNADAAMYVAKRLGKACYAVFAPNMHAEALDRLELEADLVRALERNEFVLFYQPIIDVPTGKLAGVEALLRWHHPQNGLIPPARFIQLAEETGQIVAIGRWVLREAARQLADWHAHFSASTPFFVSVNLSGRQFQHASIVDEIARVLSGFGLPAERLMIEITEAVALKDATSTIRTLHALRQLGVQLAIDDFGTGYSALSYLQRFSVDTLKLDRSFLHGVERLAGDTAIVSAIIAFSQRLQLNIIAEGVETDEQFAILRTLGCPQCQGYYCGVPVPAESITARLADTGAGFAALTTQPPCS